jgi:hypothetical protein
MKLGIGSQDMHNFKKFITRGVNKPAVNMQVWQIQNWGRISCGDQIEARKPVWSPLFFSSC